MKYITTPIYYVNDVAHLGHAYTSIIADVLARFYRLRGDGCFFLTGTDEHGQKIEEAAKAKNIPVDKYCDEISSSFKQLWDDFELSYDRFIRTTEIEHKACVQKIFKQMLESGDIYKDFYEGPYCISCESFFTQAQLNHSCCPDCGKEIKIIKEESYFFKLSKYEKPLLKWLEDEKPIIPQNKTSELINFIKSGLKDLSITRTSFSWGIKLPKDLKDDKHVIYVWLDALINYISVLGYANKENQMQELWPATAHIVGKDILRFHAIYWPAFLMSLKLALPKHIAAHGWWVVNGEKMSKSKGNVIAPKTLSDKYGIDAFRYFLLREIQFGKDGDFNEASLIARINAELCNELGNLLNRTLGMSAKYSSYDIDASDILYFTDEIARVNEYIRESLLAFESFSLNKYLEYIFKALSLANVAISKYEPWVLIKTEPKKANALIALCSNILVKAGILLSPILIKRSSLIATAFGVEFDPLSFKKYISDEQYSSFKAKKVEHLYEHIEIELKPKADLKPKEPQISLDDFSKVKIQVATVISCERIEKSDKLLRFELELEDKKIIQVLSGIAAYYDPKTLINTQVCVLSNLKKAKIFGYDSYGMILSAKDENGLSLINPQGFKTPGSLIC